MEQSRTRVLISDLSLTNLHDSCRKDSCSHSDQGQSARMWRHTCIAGEVLSCSVQPFHEVEISSLEQTLKTTYLQNLLYNFEVALVYLGAQQRYVYTIEA